MAKTVDDYLNEANAIISSRSGLSKTAAAKTAEDDEIFKLASKLTAPQSEDSSVNTLIEKIAHAVAIVDTLKNLPTFSKLADLEEASARQGISNENLTSFLEKRAHNLKITSVLDDIPWLFDQA